MSTGGQGTRDGSVSLGDEDAVKQVLAESVLELWNVVNNLTRLKPVASPPGTRRSRCSASTTIAGAGPSRP